MSADSIAISRDLVREGGLDQKAADAIAQKIVAHSDGSAASEAVARVEAKVDAEKEARAEKESDIREDIAQMKSEISEIKSKIAGLETSMKWIMGFLITMSVGIFLLVIQAFLNTPAGG